MRWFLSATLLALFALFAACSQTTPPAATLATDDAQTVTVYKSPT